MLMHSIPIRHIYFFFFFFFFFHVLYWNFSIPRATWCWRLLLRIYYINTIKHHHADHPSNTFAVELGTLRFKVLGEKVRETDKQLISTLSRYITKNNPMTKINRFITSRISKSMERLRFYRELSVDLRSERDTSAYFGSLGLLFAL